MKTIHHIHLAVVLLILCACAPDNPADSARSTAAIASEPLFTPVPADQSQITFQNTIVETVQQNVVAYDYLYNGAGIGVADFDQNGFPDLFFAGNQVDDALYFNQGGFEFSDVSSSSGILSHAGWSAGVSVVDINKDGWPDIYVCRSGPNPQPEPRTNRLFINQQNGTFKEDAAAYGLDYTGHSTQAVFVDFDLDGDLDCYLLTHPASFQNQISSQNLKEQIDSGQLESDVLFRNNNGKFEDVTKQFGMTEYAFGLGVVVSDINLDGLPDIYVSNDFDEGDYLYVNKGNFRFEQMSTRLLKHTSNYGMGCDFGDFNNDGWPDLLTLDMAFESHERAKRNMASMNPDKFNARVKLGWHYQYMANTLQRNNGNGTFSDVAQLSGVHQTDWSWAGLFADLDLDGQQDLFITNGYKRDTKDNDLKYKVDQLKAQKGNEVLLEDVLDLIPSTEIGNYAFRNVDGLLFEKTTADWGLDQRMHSHGAVYADLDNDGDLDLVVNNVDKQAALWKNNAAGQMHFLKVKAPNGYDPTGVRVGVYTAGESQFREFQPVRGYASSMYESLHFGLGDHTQVDSVVVWWAGTVASVYTEVAADQTLEVALDNVTKRRRYVSAPKLFQNALSQVKLGVSMPENEFDGFEREILLPQKMSTEGPLLATGDINGDGLDDLWIGGAAGTSGMMLWQRAEGDFYPATHRGLEADAQHEDAGGCLVDVDGDGDLDLYVASGGNEQAAGSAYYQDRLYLNDGSGNMERSNSIPELNASSGRVIAHDADGDGDVDLLVLGRQDPGRYPFPGQTQWLINEGGEFTDKIEEMAPDLQFAGMLTDAVFADMDQDGDEDLIVVGEWISPRVYPKKKGKYSYDASFTPDGLKGWWYSVEAADVNADGRMDLICGNLGWNNKFHPSADAPLECYTTDFDGNGTLDIVLAKHRGEEMLPVRGRECSSQQMPYIAEKFETYQDFAEADLREIYSAEKLETAYHVQAETFSSVVLLNNGNTLEVIELPAEAQLAPIRALRAEEINGDGHMDLLLTGNMFGTEVETERYDAGGGAVLLGRGDGTFTALSPQEHGFNTPADARDLIKLTMANGQPLYVVSNNQQITQAFFLRPAPKDQQ